MATYNGAANNVNSGSTASLACSSSKSVAVGDLIHVAVKHEGGSTSVTVADGLGNTFTQVDSLNHSGGEPELVTFRCVVTNAGLSAPAATLGAARVWVAIMAHFFTPAVGKTFTADTPGHAIAEGNATTYSSGALSITAAGAASAFVATYQIAGVTQGSGWTETYDADTAYAEYRLPSGSGSITGDATTAVADRFVAGILHTIEVDGGGPALLGPPALITNLVRRIGA